MKKFDKKMHQVLQYKRKNDLNKILLFSDRIMQQIQDDFIKNFDTIFYTNSNYNEVKK